MSTLHRREFLKGLGGLAAASALPAGAAEPEAKPARLRTISYNVLACTGFPPNKARMAVPDLRREMPKRFATALRRYVPDVLTFSEAPADDILREMASAMGMHLAIFPSPEQWPGALMTKYDMKLQQNCPIDGGKRPDLLFTRHWGMASLTTPMGDLKVHSVHLHPSDAETRGIEIDEVLTALKPDLEGQGSVIVQGDFNFTMNMPEYKKFFDAGLIDTFQKKGAGPGNSFSSERPSRRIDYIWARGPIVEKLVEARVLQEIPFRRDGRDPNSFGLSDHLPIVATFGG